MPSPTPSDVRHDPLLSNVSVAYLQETTAFAAHRVFPRVPVAMSQGKYWHYPRGHFMRDDVGPRPLGGRVPQTSFAVEKLDYSIEEEGLSSTLDDRERANATPPYDPERARVRLLTQKILIHRERAWASAFFRTGVWSTDRTGVSTDPNVNAGQFLQFDQSNSDPIGLFQQYIDRVASSTGFEPNRLVLGRDTWRVVRNHEDVIDRIKHTQRGVATRAISAALVGVDEVLVPGGVYNASPEGVTDNIDWIINPKGALLVYAASEPSIDAPSGGYTFSWTGLLGEGEDAVEVPVMRARFGPEHSDWFEVRIAHAAQLVAADLGVFFDACVGD